MDKVAECVGDTGKIGKGMRIMFEGNLTGRAHALRNCGSLRLVVRREAELRDDG